MKPEVQSFVEHLGVAVAAFTGVLAARGKRIDLFGVVVLALVTAFGGGTVRDLMLGDQPVFWIKRSGVVITAVAAAGLMFFLARWRPPPGSLLLVADALALAFFSMLGLGKALAFGVSPTIAVAMGVITGVAGGIARDVLLGEIPIVFRPETTLYATAALIGCSAYLVALWCGLGSGYRALLGVSMVTLLRMVGVRWRLTLPEYRDASHPGSGVRT
jgi:uncharacterized membrane protein YeiH